VAARGVEKILLPLIRQTLLFFAYIILFALIVTLASGAWQSVLLLGLFGLACLNGQLMQFALLTWMGSGCFILTVVNFLLRDIKSLPESARMSSFFLAALFFIVIGVYVAWVEHRLNQPPPHYHRR
jgi:hypothetical protein